MWILKATGNIKNPKLENSETIKKYCAENNDPYDVLWLPSNKENFESILNRYPGIPTVLIYDRKNTLLENANGEECQKMLISFFSDSLKYKYKVVNDSSLSYLRSRIKPIDTGNLFENYDYVVVYSWVKYVPKITEDLFQRLSAVKATDKRKICFISLNKDWQQGMYDKAPKLNGKVQSDGKASAPKQVAQP